MFRRWSPWRKPPAAFQPIDRFRTLQQEIISLQRRIEGLNTTLGVLIGAGVAFSLYAMSQHANWKPYQGGSMWVAATGLVLCLLGFVTSSFRKEWLDVDRFFVALDSDPKALDQAIADGLKSYEAGLNSERQKSNFQGYGASLLVAGAITYVAIGYKALAPLLPWVIGIAASILALFVYGQLVRLWTHLFKRDKMETL